LGEIFDEQSIDGLIGKVLASRHRVRGYHFQLFEILNENGQFVVIFDGFDEMKHGMTPARFERVMNTLMKLDRENAKLVILGRDTAFHTDEEFQAIIEGQRVTSGGQLVKIRDRRACIQKKMSGFTLSEARDFVSRYFPIKVRELNPNHDSVWLDQRILELLDDKLSELLVRPVHAQMLCDIATRTETTLRNVSKFQLYDQFVHFLIEREVDKKGRYPGFNIEIRRRFNASLAWWLWKNGGASTTSIATVPIALCYASGDLPFHEFDEQGLKRELIAGCLIEKGDDAVFFGHRSIQEFLVAEFLMRGDALLSQDGRPSDVTSLVSLLNHEIVENCIGWITKQEFRADRVSWEIGKRAFVLVTALLAWPGSVGIRFGETALKEGIVVPGAPRLFVMLAWALAAYQNSGRTQLHLAATLLASLFSGNPADVPISNPPKSNVKSQDFPLWLFFQCADISRSPGSYSQIRVDLRGIVGILVAEVASELTYAMRAELEKLSHQCELFYAPAELLGELRKFDLPVHRMESIRELLLGPNT
jgi:hypothetical protein